MRLLDRVKSIAEAGDFISPDEFVSELDSKNIEADYENVASGTAFCWTILTAQDDDEAVETYIENDRVTGWIVKDVRPI